jgi:hypothetical protein
VRWRLASNRRLVLTLRALATYLLVLYAPLRWATGSADRYPGSD